MRKNNNDRCSRWRRRKKKNRYEIRNELLAKHQRLNLEELYGPGERKRLEVLKKDLLALGTIPKDPAGIIRFNVKFLDVLSKFQDQGYINYQPIAKKDEMETLNLLILKSGRQEPNSKRWNHSKKGEKVTIHNVFYGDIFGLPFKPASYWLAQPKSYKVTIDFHTALAIDKNSDTSIVSTKTQWVTEAIVKAGVERFNINNYNVALTAINSLLAA